jgi:large subunit ribosomal protein L13
MNTYIPKKGEVQPKWYIVDADGQSVGRVATVVATLLRGKHRPQFTPFLDHGDHVIVLNASRLRWTGRKLEQKVYRHYTGYPGGLREVSAKKLMETRPDLAVKEAVMGMLPKNKLRDRQAFRLKVYAENEHPHEAQMPEPYSLTTGKQ